jgi:DNA-binding NarL/FixJ family response regulator
MAATRAQGRQITASAEPAAPAARVYIASEVRLYREGLTGMLARCGGLEIIGHGAFAEALAEIGALGPDVVLLDYTGENCRIFCQEAHALLPGLRLVAVAVGELDDEVIACAEAGICEYVRRSGSVEDVERAITRSLTGEVLCSPRVAALLFARLAGLSSRQGEALAGANLTLREREIAGLVARGLANKEVARRLRLSHATVKNHVHNILNKLGIQRRGEIAGLRIATRPGAPDSQAAGRPPTPG